jgi:hypothetical protein
MKIEIKFDPSNFLKGLDMANKIVLEAVERGVGVAMLSMLGDCINESPTVPLKEGWLRGSGSVFVQNKFIDSSEKMATAKAKFALTAHSEPIQKEETVGVIGFNAPYASRLHEGIDFHFTEPSSGPKYLEAKMHSNKERYMKIVAEEVKKGLEK